MNSTTLRRLGRAVLGAAVVLRAAPAQAAGHPPEDAPEPRAKTEHIREPGADAWRTVGPELDRMVRWTPRRHGELETGWSYLDAGQLLTDTGADRNIRFSRVGATFTL